MLEGPQPSLETSEALVIFLLHFQVIYISHTLLFPLLINLFTKSFNLFLLFTVLFPSFLIGISGHLDFLWLAALHFTCPVSIIEEPETLQDNTYYRWANTVHYICKNQKDERVTDNFHLFGGVYTLN